MMRTIDDSTWFDRSNRSGRTDGFHVVSIDENVDIGSCRAVNILRQSFDVLQQYRRVYHE